MLACANNRCAASALGGAQQDTAAVLIKDAKTINARPAAGQEELKADIRPLSLDPNGNCRVDILAPVPEGNTMIKHPWSRCYIVESTLANGTVLRTSGYALSATRVITSDVHFEPPSTKVSRAYVFGDLSGPHTTHFDSEWANAVRAFTNTDR